MEEKRDGNNEDATVGRLSSFRSGTDVIIISGDARWKQTLGGGGGVFEEGLVASSACFTGSQLDKSE